MIDTVYYESLTRAEPRPPAPEESASRRDWDPRDNPHVRDLLDHLARELAEEYIRLMKAASKQGGDER